VNPRLLFVCVLAASITIAPAFADDTASVAVQVEQPHQGTVPDLVTAYGSAMPALNGGMTLSFQQEGRVLALDVTPGETVRAGTPLLEFGASATAVSAYQQAISGLAAARQEREHIAALLTQQLATRDQLAQADKVVADAQATLDAFRREGADRSHQILTAPFDGVIATIPVAQGDRVQAGTSLMTITRFDGLVVTVGVDPEFRSRVHAGDSVELTSLLSGKRLEGQILRIDGALNPKTRLLDTDLSVPSGAVVSGEAFKADITIGQLTGWIVPHEAILIDDNWAAHLFQVEGTTASRVDVKVVGRSGADDVVEGSLNPKLPIVIQGNYQLSDKGKVRVDASQ
jgi:RND family efflux transporter MFP subunit